MNHSDVKGSERNGMSLKQGQKHSNQPTIKYTNYWSVTVTLRLLKGRTTDLTAEKASPAIRGHATTEEPLRGHSVTWQHCHRSTPLT